MASKEVTDFYDILLVAPGLEKDVKLDSKISGREALFLVIAVEYALASVEPGNPVTKILTEEDRAKLQEFLTGILQKTGAQAFYERLKKKFG